LAGTQGPNREEQEAKRIVMQAALTHLETRKSHDSEQFTEIYDDLALHYEHRLANLDPGRSKEISAHHERHAELSREATRVERETAIGLRDEGRISDEVLRRIERELDLMDSRGS
jgi:CPA1 family monovalent cation:H+ antiporter